MRMEARVFFRHRGHTRAIVKCPLYACQTLTKLPLCIPQPVALKIQPKWPRIVGLLVCLISRVISTMNILDHPKPLKTGSFGIHMPMAMRMMVLHTTATSCGDQDYASVHDVNLHPVHIGRAQCTRRIPWHTRFIIMGVDGSLWSSTVSLDMPLLNFNDAH